MWWPGDPSSLCCSGQLSEALWRLIKCSGNVAVEVAALWGQGPSTLEGPAQVAKSDYISKHLTCLPNSSFYRDIAASFLKYCVSSLHSPCRRQAATLCSPFILLYGLALCCLQYIWSIELQHELPTTLGTMRLNQLGLDRAKYPCLRLGAMVRWGREEFDMLRVTLYDRFNIVAPGGDLKDMSQ